jgi:ABC-type polysaccharide/polyol phosphate transport system ATPase subunit
MNSYIKLENVSLDYILKGNTGSLRKFAIQTLRKFFNLSIDITCFNHTYRALDNINLDIKQGDKIGILGRNGAGKSTLLRVLAEIYKPNIGKTSINGNISSLFDISLGLNPEATGYENIITLGVLKGMRYSQAKELIDDIAEFTELQDYLAKPIRVYSSGMAMKLAFGIATAGTPDILLVDEVIGVGDGKFMQKATARIQKLLQDSNILILTSHDNNVIRKFCDKAIVLDKGKILYNGDVDSAIEFYNNVLFPKESHYKNSETTLTVPQ